MTLSTPYDRLVRLERLIARLPYPSPAVQLTTAVAALVTQALIGVTGSVVRVTGSGLGCPTWPQCHADSMFPTEHAEYAWLNQWIEFGNRLLTGIVGLVAVACVIVAWRVHLAVGGRRRPLLLAWTILGGTGLQGVLGGITVRMQLEWWTVAVHFLASVPLVWVAVMLVHAFREGDDPPRPLAGTAVRGLLVVAIANLAAILAAGTVVTGAGPHGGDPQTPRLDAPIELLARVHAGLLVCFLVVLVLIGLSLLRGHPPARFVRRYAALWLVVLVQGGIGSLQYELGVPEGLVSLHVLGSALVVITMATLWCAARDRGPAPAPTIERDSAAKPAAATV